MSRKKEYKHSLIKAEKQAKKLTNFKPELYADTVPEFSPELHAEVEPLKQHNVDVSVTETTIVEFP